MSKSISNRENRTHVKTKKGVSLAVGWALLVGLSVTLTIFVGVWLKQQAASTGEALVLNADIEQRCADTILAAEVNCAEDISSGTYTISHYNISNRGYFDIVDIKCFGKNSEEGILKTGGIKTETLNSCNSINNNGQTQVIVVPVITVGGKQYGCGEKGVSLRC